MNTKTAVKVGIAAGAVALVGSLGGCASCSRSLKSLESDMSGGMDRKVTLYDYSGKEIQSWEGWIDLDNSEEETFFDLNGKRVVIHGGIVVAEEV